MKKIATLLIIFFLTMILYACGNGLSDDNQQIEQTISLIDLAETNNQQTIDDALNAFNNLKETAKYEVSNYTKLFYLTAKEPDYFTINSKTQFSQEAIDEYLGKTIQIKSISEISAKMNMIDFKDASFDDVDLSIFESKTVLITIEQTTWHFNQNDEIFLYRHYPLGLLLVFYKENHPFMPDASYYGIRFIVLDTIYPITLLPTFQVIFTNQIPL